MEINKLRSIIKEAIKDVHLKEIEAVAENAAMEARLAEYGKAIKMCEDKIEMAESLEEMKELVDDAKLNELKKKLKSLTKAKEKLEKAKAKKNKGKEVVTEEPMDEPAVEEGDVMDSMENAIVPEMNYTMEEEETINESFLKMQKLAGVITEAQFNQKKNLIDNQLNENKIGDLIKKVFSKPEKKEDKPSNDKIVQQADTIAAQAEREAAQKKKEEDLAKFTTELDKNQRLQELLEAYLKVVHEYDSQERFQTMQYGYGSFEPSSELESSLTTARNNLYNYTKSRGIDPESISSIFYSLQGALSKAKEATKARYKA